MASGGHFVTVLVSQAMLPRQYAISLDTMTMLATHQELSKFHSVKFVFASSFEANI